MRVLLLDLGQEMRGGQRQVLYLARALAAAEAAGEDVSGLIACPRTSPLACEAALAGLPLLALPGRSIANPALMFVLERALRREHITIIHTQDAHAATVGAWFSRLHSGVCLVHSRRVSYPARPGMRGKKYLQADAIIGVSREITEGMIASGVSAERAYTVHSGIDPTLYARKIDRQDGRFVFGAIGALTPQKGFSVLIQAMSVLSEMEDLPPWEVRLVGEGQLFDTLLDEARALHVEHRLALFGRQDSRIMLPQFDTLLAPSLDGEGSSAVIKEGWVVGVPVVCSALASNEELVTDKTNGLCVPRGNPIALGTAMLRLIKEPTLRERLVVAGQARVQDFTAARMAERTIDVYKKLEQHHGAKHALPVQAAALPAADDVPSNPPADRAAALPERAAMPEQKSDRAGRHKKV